MNLEISLIQKLDESAVKLNFKTPTFRKLTILPACASSSTETKEDVSDVIKLKRRKIAVDPVIAANIMGCSMDELNQVIASLDYQTSTCILQQLNISELNETFQRNLKLVLLYTASLNCGLENSADTVLNQKYYSDSVFKTIISHFKNGTELALNDFEQAAEITSDLEKLMIVLSDLLQKKVIPAQEIISVIL